MGEQDHRSAPGVDKGRVGRGGAHQEQRLGGWPDIEGLFIGAIDRRIPDGHPQLRAMIGVPQGGGGLLRHEMTLAHRLSPRRAGQGRGRQDQGQPAQNSHH